MKVSEEIKNWIKVIWGLIGAFGLLFGIVVGYKEYFGNPNVFSQISNEINVLDINEPLKDLQIIFQGDNIQKENLNLRIYRVKIENNGGTNITQNDFDQGDNWGIRVKSGSVIETRLVNTNSKYINANLSPSIQDNNVVKFNKIIFDKGNFFTVELLVLHDKDAPPVLYRIGKIAGIKGNELEILTLEHSEPFWATFFYGNWIINLVRFIFYGLVAILIFISVIIVIIKLDERRKKAAQSPQPPQQPS